MCERLTYKDSQQACGPYEILAEKGPHLDKKQDIDKRLCQHLFDDAMLESMLRYYNIEANYEVLLRYIKSQAVLDYEGEFP